MIVLPMHAGTVHVACVLVLKNPHVCSTRFCTGLGGGGLGEGGFGGGGGGGEGGVGGGEGGEMHDGEPIRR